MAEMSTPLPGGATRTLHTGAAQVRANPLMRALLGSSPPRLSVLIYHRVLAERDPLRPTEPTAAEFEARMAWVKAHFDVLPLVEAVERLKTDSLPRRALAITFDDGYADNHDVALPILLRLGLPATFFVATGYLDGGRMFNDTVIESVRQAKGDILDAIVLGLERYRIGNDDERRAAIAAILVKLRSLPPTERELRVIALAHSIGAVLPADLMMTSEQVAALDRAGMEIGGHTVHHPVLAGIGMDEAEREIVDGRRSLEAIVGHRVRLFAYPRGWPGRDYTSAHVKLVRELGFDGAVCSTWGVSTAGVDLFQIPRFTPWDKASWKFGLRLARNLRHVAYEVA